MNQVQKQLTETPAMKMVSRPGRALPLLFFPGGVPPKPRRRGTDQGGDGQDLDRGPQGDPQIDLFHRIVAIIPVEQE